MLYCASKQAVFAVANLCSLSTQLGCRTDRCDLLLTASCSHGGRKFFTFDGAAFDYNLTTCWHLLAKDCSGQSRFAILMRSVHNNETVNICVTFIVFGALTSCCMLNFYYEVFIYLLLLLLPRSSSPSSSSGRKMWQYEFVFNDPVYDLSFDSITS
jgi:hypothetical protein